MVHAQIMNAGNYLYIYIFIYLLLGNNSFITKKNIYIYI